MIQIFLLVPVADWQRNIVESSEIFRFTNHQQIEVILSLPTLLPGVLSSLKDTNVLLGKILSLHSRFHYRFDPEE